MPLPWPSSMLGYVAVRGPLVALAGGLIGALIGAALASDSVQRPRRAGLVLASAALVVPAVAAFGLHTTPTSGLSGKVTLTDAASGPKRTVFAQVALSPRDAADRAQWVTATAWQGKGFVLDRLVRVREGVYRTTKPIPVHGSWKALIRIHRGDSLEALPIYLPRDPGIPAAEVPAEKSFTRSFVPDKEVLQREAKSNAAWLTVVAYLTVLACALGLFALLAWGLRRLALEGRAGWRSGPTPRGRQERASRFASASAARAA
jgi:hypothetical protein